MRRVGPSPDTVSREQSILWPDVEVVDTGLFFEGVHPLRDRGRLVFGARLDRFEASISEADRQPIPPLQGRLRLTFDRLPWKASATVRYALRQTRVDDDPAAGSGLDTGETPGHAVLDLLASRTFARGLELQVGVENAFDRRYADHLIRSNLFDVEQVRVNEPGRTVWLRVRLRSRSLPPA